MAYPTAAQLRAVVKYDPETGQFCKCADNRPVGHISPALGYVFVYIAGQQYYGHQLAWLYMTGQWPASQIDHRDGNKADNRWKNLRAADSGQQKMNVGTRRDNRLGHKGIQLTRSGNFRVRVSARGRTTHDQCYPTLDEAISAHAIAVQAAHGDFARPR